MTNDVLQFNQNNIWFNNKELKMITIKNISPFILYQKYKIENLYYQILTATVSHDMRTPLNAISGLLDNLHFFVTDERGNTMLNVIKNSSKILLFLVNDLLDFFQIKNGKFKKNQSQTNVKKSVEDLIEIFQIAAK